MKNNSVRYNITTQYLIPSMFQTYNRYKEEEDERIKEFPTFYSFLFDRGCRMFTKKYKGLKHEMFKALFKTILYVNEVMEKEMCVSSIDDSKHDEVYTDIAKNPHSYKKLKKGVINYINGSTA